MTTLDLFIKLGIVGGIGDLLGQLKAAGDAAVKFGELIVGQNQKLQQLQFQGAAALANTLTVTEAVTGKQIEGIEKIQALRAVAAGQQLELEKKSFDIVGVTSQQLQSVLAVTNQQVQLTGFTLSQNTDIATSFAAALGTYGVPLEQARQEVQSILSGQIDTNSVLAQALSITSEQVKAEKEKGTLYDFLIEKTKAAADANKLQSQTIEGYTSNLQELFDQFARSLGEPLTDEITKQLGELYDYVIQNKDALLSIAKEAGPYVSATFEVFARAVKSAYETLRDLTEAIGSNKIILEALASTLGGKVLFVFNTFLISLNGLSLLLKIVGTGFQEFQAIVANGLNITKTKADIARLDEELRLFAEKQDKRNKELGAAAFQGLVNPNYVKDQIAKLAAIEKAEQEKRASDLKAIQENTNTQEAQTAESRLKEFKRTEDTKTAFVEANLAKQKLGIEQSLGDRATAQKEADADLLEADRTALQSRIAILQEERRLTALAVGDQGKEVAALDKKIANLRIESVKAEIAETARLRKEAQDQELATATAKGALNSGELATATALLELAKQKATADQASYEKRLAVLTFEGDTFLIEKERVANAARQLANLTEQFQITARINELNNRGKQIALEIEALQLQFTITEKKRLGASAEEIALLEAKAKLIKEQQGIYEQIAKGQKEAAQEKLISDTAELLQHAANSFERDKIIKHLDEVLLKQKLSLEQIEDINKALKKQVEIAGKRADGAGGGGGGSGGGSSSRGGGGSGSTPRGNLAPSADPSNVNDVPSDGLKSPIELEREADDRRKASQEEESNKRYSKPSYDGRGGGFSNQPAEAAAAKAKQDYSDRYSDALSRYNAGALERGDPILSYGDRVPATQARDNAPAPTPTSPSPTSAQPSPSPTNFNTGSIPSAYGGDAGTAYLESKYGPQIPDTANGIIQRATPGGAIRRIAEAGDDEAVIPLNNQGARFIAASLGQFQLSAPSVTVNQEQVVAKLDSLQQALMRIAANGQPITIYGSDNPAMDASTIQASQLTSALRGAGL
jgi:uncharacterized membrane protein YgcG